MKNNEEENATKFYPLVNSSLECCQTIESIADFVACKFDIVNGFIDACEKAGVDTDGFEESLVSGNVDSNLRKTLLDWVDGAIAIKPGKMIQYPDGKGGYVEIPDARSKPKKAFELTESQCESLLKFAGILKAIRPTSQMKHIIRNREYEDKDKFLTMLDMLFDNMYKCYDEDETFKAKLFLMHAMVNTKRLICGLNDEWQQLFGLWSSSKGTGKDVLINSLIYGLTGEEVITHKFENLIRNFNLELARTKGFYYISEITNIEGSRKNEIKAMVTQPMITIEQKGKEVQEVPRRFTICLTANEDPSRVFNDENKERRSGFARLTGTNYYYESKEVKNKFYLLSPFFAWMWLYCPREYWYDTSKVKDEAEKDSSRTISNGMDIMEKLEELSNSKEVANKVNIEYAKDILKGGKFSKKRLETLFKGSVFQTWELTKFLGSDYVKSLAQGKFKINIDYYNAQKNKPIEVEHSEFYVPSITLRVEDLVKSVQDGVPYNFPKPQFKKKEEVIEEVYDFGFKTSKPVSKGSNKQNEQDEKNETQVKGHSRASSTKYTQNWV